MEHVTIFEVGPRDGLQNEIAILPTRTKVGLIDLLSAVGFEKIEVTSFVSPKWVPQLADADCLLRQIRRRPGVSYAALTPNLKGLDRAMEAGADEVAVFAAASETFSQKNINCSISESLERFRPILDRASEANIPVRGYVSCIAGCPYEGEISPSAVRDVSQALLDMGCYQVSLGDTTGIGTPKTISAVLEEVLRGAPAERIAGHYHDTKLNAVANVLASLDFGIRTFDSSVCGLGGCPFAPGARGNIATGTLALTLSAKGFDTGLDLVRLQRVENYIRAVLKMIKSSEQEERHELVPSDRP